MTKKHGLTDDEVADLKEAFSMFDIDGDGASSSREVRVDIRDCFAIALSRAMDRPAFNRTVGHGHHYVLIRSLGLFTGRWVRCDAAGSLFFPS